MKPARTAATIEETTDSIVSSAGPTLLIRAVASDAPTPAAWPSSGSSFSPTSTFKASNAAVNAFCWNSADWLITRNARSVEPLAVCMAVRLAL